MENNEVSWLMNWFALHCNKCWEHMFGVLIETNKEPGWTISIDLEDTDLEHLEFTEINKDINSNDWLYCAVKDKEFLIKTSSKNFLESLKVFRLWAEPLYMEIYEMPLVAISDDQILWLIEWYNRLCDNGLSSKSRIRIATLDNPGWNFVADLGGNGLEVDNFKVIHVDRTEEDWYHIFIRDNIFYGPGGNFNLGEVLNVLLILLKEIEIKSKRYRNCQSTTPENAPLVGHLKRPTYQEFLDGKNRWKVSCLTKTRLENFGGHQKRPA